MMIHFTMTGYHCGLPYCGIDKEAAKQRGDTFCHVPYNDGWKNWEDLCPTCRAMEEEDVAEYSTKEETNA